MGLSLQMNVKYQCSGLQRCSGVQISPLLWDADRRRWTRRVQCPLPRPESDAANAPRPTRTWALSLATLGPRVKVFDMWKGQYIDYRYQYESDWGPIQAADLISWVCSASGARRKCWVLTLQGKNVWIQLKWRGILVLTQDSLEVSLTLLL